MRATGNVVQYEAEMCSRQEESKIGCVIFPAARPIPSLRPDLHTNADGALSGHLYTTKKIVDPRLPSVENDLWLANCYLVHNSLGSPVLLAFCAARFGDPFHPFPRYAGSRARTRWGPFRSGGVTAG